MDRAFFTPWGEQLDMKNPLPEYPRMQLVRDSFHNLNGIWEYQITDPYHEPRPSKWKKIVVPFAVGSKLSGAEEIVKPGDVLWYRKQFAYQPSALHTYLNFEAVDQKCVVYVNGIEAGRHNGGYTPFSIDISSFIKYQNSLMVKVVDDSNYGEYAYGKQKIDHGGMWYTPTAGIWQTVWIEDIPEHAVHDIKITPDLDESKVYLELAGNFDQAHIIISADGSIVHEGITNDMHYETTIENVHPWTPDDPFLYDVYIETEDDLIRSYFGMRKFSKGRDKQGRTHFLLNNKPVFLTGVLDQGYTSDGMLTYPSDAAMKFDIMKAKELGFNMLRKHVKIECRRWYYHCDRLGMLVMQDMPNGGEEYSFFKTAVLPNIGIRKLKDVNTKAFGRAKKKSRNHYYEELDEMLNDLYNAVCIFAWVPFNEGWGQFNSKKVTAHIRDYDMTRLIDSASGWHDRGEGDFNSHHAYFRDFKVPRKLDNRILILSEFGGYSFVVKDHAEVTKEYGYKKYKDPYKMQDAIEFLYETNVLEQISEGLAGCIYTQLSDVEDECNGIFTMDRRVLKVDKLKIKEINDLCKRRIYKNG